MEGRLVGPDGPLSGREVSLSLSVRLEGQQWTGVGERTAESDGEGKFGVEVPCGARIDLSVRGWQWRSAPTVWMAEPDMGTTRVALAPENTVRLFVHGGEDRVRPKNVRFFAPGDTIGLPVPYEGLELMGLSLRRLAGEIRADDLPSRNWYPARSDDLEEVGPGRYEAVVVVGEVPTSWVSMSPRDFRDVGGVQCLVDAGRGKACRRVQGVWNCDCPVGSSVGVHAKRWDVGFTRPLDETDLHLEGLPDAVETCLDFASVTRTGATASFRPGGWDAGLLVSGMPRPVRPKESLCLRLPRGESLEVLLDEGRAGQWRITPQGKRDVALTEGGAVWTSQ